MVFPFTLIALGILLLLNNLYPALGFGRTWPVLLVVIGLVKVVEYFRSSPEVRGPDAGGATEASSERGDVQ